MSRERFGDISPVPGVCAAPARPLSAPAPSALGPGWQ